MSHLCHFIRRSAISPRMIASPHTAKHHCASQRNTVSMVLAFSHRISVPERPIDIFSPAFIHSAAVHRIWVSSSIARLTKACFSECKSLLYIACKSTSKWHSRFEWQNRGSLSDTSYRRLGCCLEICTDARESMVNVRDRTQRAVAVLGSKKLSSGRIVRVRTAGKVRREFRTMSRAKSLSDKGEGEVNSQRSREICLYQRKAVPNGKSKEIESNGRCP